MLEVVYTEQTNLPPMLKIKRCPYWDRVDGYHYQNNGFCHWLDSGDWESKGHSLLWDQVKECGLRNYSEKEERKMYVKDEK